MAENDRVYLWHKDIDATIQAPDTPDVIADYESRGWKVVPTPGPVPSYPSPDGIGLVKYDPKDFNPAPVSEPKPKKVTSNG